MLQNGSKFNSFKFYLYVIRIVDTSERWGEGNATPKQIYLKNATFVRLMLQFFYTFRQKDSKKVFPKVSICTVDTDIVIIAEGMFSK